MHVTLLSSKYLHESHLYGDKHLVSFCAQAPQMEFMKVWGGTLIFTPPRQRCDTATINPSDGVICSHQVDTT